MKQSWIKCKLPSYLILASSVSSTLHPIPDRSVALSTLAVVLLLLLRLALTTLYYDGLFHLAISPTTLWALKKLELRLDHCGVPPASSTLPSTEMMLNNYY